MAATILFVVVSLLVSACTTAQSGSTKQRLDNYFQGKDDKPFIATDGQFRSIFPSPPTRDAQKVRVPDIDITITNTKYTSGFSDTSFLVSFADYPHRPGIGMDLHGTVDSTAAAAANGKVVSSEFGTFQGFPAVEYVVSYVQDGPKFYKATAFIKGQRLYQIAVVGPDNPPKGYDKFLSAFALVS